MTGASADADKAARAVAPSGAPTGPITRDRSRPGRAGHEVERIERHGGSVLLPLAAIALGAGLAAWYLLRRLPMGQKPPRRFAGRFRRRPLGRDRYAAYSPGPDGRMDTDTLADAASEASFPASDPPARMTSVILGSPRV